MPIDFAALAARFREPLRAQTAPLTPVFERLADAVKRLAEQAEAPSAPRVRIPILRYRGDALSVRLETLGAAPFSTQPPLGFIATLRAGGQDFLDRIGWTRAAVRQELAIPAVVAVAADALEIVVASMERFERPFPAMFDPRARRLSDVFGLLALGYRSLLGDAARRQLVDVAGGAGRALGALDSSAPATRPRRPSPGPSPRRSTASSRCSRAWRNRRSTRSCCCPCWARSRRSRSTTGCCGPSARSSSASATWRRRPWPCGGR